MTLGDGPDDTIISLEDLMNDPVLVGKPFLRQHDQLILPSRFRSPVVDSKSKLNSNLKLLLYKQGEEVKVKLFQIQGHTICDEKN